MQSIEQDLTSTFHKTVDLVRDDASDCSDLIDKGIDFPEFAMSYDEELGMVANMEAKNNSNHNKVAQLELNSNFNLIFSNWGPVFNYRDEMDQEFSSSFSYYTDEHCYSQNTNYSNYSLGGLDLIAPKPPTEDSSPVVISPNSIFVPRGSRFFVIKSYNESDVRSSFSHKVWSSTDLGNKRLNKAFKSKQISERILLFFSVNGSGKFCGVAEMCSELSNKAETGKETSSIWLETRWKGQFSVQWIVVKDILNSKVKHLKVPLNDWKPVTNSRDTQELPFDIGTEMIQIFKKTYSNSSFLQNMLL